MFHLKTAHPQVRRYRMKSLAVDHYLGRSGAVFGRGAVFWRSLSLSLLARFLFASSRLLRQSSIWALKMAIRSSFSPGRVRSWPFLVTPMKPMHISSVVAFPQRTSSGFISLVLRGLPAELS